MMRKYNELIIRSIAVRLPPEYDNYYVAFTVKLQKWLRWYCSLTYSYQFFLIKECSPQLYIYMLFVVPSISFALAKELWRLRPIPLRSSELWPTLVALLSRQGTLVPRKIQVASIILVPTSSTPS